MTVHGLSFTTSESGTGKVELLLAVSWLFRESGVMAPKFDFLLNGQELNHGSNQ